MARGISARARSDESSFPADGCACSVARCSDTACGHWRRWARLNACTASNPKVGCTSRGGFCTICWCGVWPDLSAEMGGPGILHRYPILRVMGFQGCTLFGSVVVGWNWILVFNPAARSLNSDAEALAQPDLAADALCSTTAGQVVRDSQMDG
jgi:hypothetical protein